MMPAAWAQPKDVEKKKKAIDERRSTSHWAVGVKLFGGPRIYGPKDKELHKIFAKEHVPRPKLTKRGKQLVGMIPYDV